MNRGLTFAVSRWSMTSDETLLELRSNIQRAVYKFWRDFFSPDEFNLGPHREDGQIKYP
jgi:hypothetical protein